MKLNLQYFGGRGTGGGKRTETTSQAESISSSNPTITAPAASTTSKVTESNKSKNTSKATFTPKSTWEEINTAIKSPKDGDKLVFTKLDGTKETYTYGREDRTDYLDRTERSAGGYGKSTSRYIAEEWVSTTGHTLPREDMARHISIFTGARQGFQQRYKKVVYKKK